MSHFTTVKTKITNLTALEAAARQLGLNVQRDTTARGWNGQKINAPMVIAMNHYDIAVIPAVQQTKPLNNNPLTNLQPITAKPIPAYELTADWDMLGHDPIVGYKGQKLVQEYSCQVILEQARLRGLQVNRQTQPDGSVQMVVRGVR